MKRLKAFGNLIFCGGVVLGLVAFILFMATPAVSTDAGGFDGINAIFGGKVWGIAYKPLGTALAAWILVLIAVVFGLCAFVLGFLKVRLPDIAAAGIKCLVAILLLVAGILAFCVAGDFDAGTVGAGWVIGGILAIVGALAAACPAVLTFVK